MDPGLVELIERTPPDREAEVLVKLKDPARPPPALRVVAAFGDIATGRVAGARLGETWNSDRIVSLKAPKFVRAEIAQPAEPESGAIEAATAASARAEEEPRRRPDVPEDGTGVVVAFLDWGFDLAHPAFRRADGTTRVLAFWDQGSTRGGAENAYGYGAIHTRESIEAALGARDPYAALGYHPADSDPLGDGAHGTHVADIAAGSGLVPGSQPGIAPGADLVLVQLDSDAVPGLANLTLGDSVRLLEALDFVRTIAAGRPWVANLSLGATGGPKDATTLVEQGMDRLLERERSAAIVCSCGNYYDAAMHAAGQLTPGERLTLGWEIHADDRTPNELEVWYSGIERFTAIVRPPASEEQFTAELGSHVRIVAGGREVGRLYHRAAEPNTNDNHIDIFLERDAPAGRWEVTLVGTDVMDGRFDAWIERDGSRAGSQSHFRATEAARERTIGTICTGLRTIAVGAYDAHDAARPIAPFSSAGYSRDGRLKPELVAPGVRVLAARSASRSGEARGAAMTRKSGTSMAAPHVTGALALLFQASPRSLKIWETRALLLGNAERASSEDPRRVGGGYLDIEAALRAARSLPAEPAHDPAELFAESEPIERHGRSNGMLNDNGESESGGEAGSGIAASDARPGTAELSEPPSAGEIIVSVAEESVVLDRAANSGERLVERLMRNGTVAQRAGEARRAPSIRDFVIGGETRGPAEAGGVRCVARAREPLSPLVRGDVIVTTLPGSGSACLSIVAEPEVHPRDSLAAARLRPLEQAAGGYVHVIEPGPTPRSYADRCARRITDRQGRVVANRAVVRFGAAELERSAPPVRIRAREAAAEAAAPIDPASIRFLAFEGGGGKGFTFLGAIEALESAGILRYRAGGFGLLPPAAGGTIEGVAGASAGAITATLVASGYASGALRTVLANDFSRFFDDPRPGLVVRVKAGPTRTATLPLLSWLPAVLRAAGPTMLAELLLRLTAAALDPPFDRLLDPARLGGYLDCLRVDFGFFDGWEARRFFDARIREAHERIAQRSDPAFGDATFATHHQVTGVKLAIAGANLSTRKSELFSVDTTPNLPVADAVRISMGIPIAFKPVVITNPRLEGIAGAGPLAMGDGDLRGFWVDGGLLNNMPIRAFDDPAHTLGFRLDIDRPNYAMTSLGAYLGALVGTLIGAGEAHISRSWRTAQRTIMLDTTGLSTLDFDPPPAVRDARIADARATVLRRLRRVESASVQAA